MTKYDNVVESLLAMVSLTDLVERLGLATDRRNGVVKAICPFHDDTSPSLALYDSVNSGDRPHFHCFACGAHGDIFHLTQQKLSKSFPDAVSWLAHQYGVVIPKRRDLIAEKTSTESDTGRRAEGFKRALDIFNNYSGDNEIEKLAVERSFELEFLNKVGIAIAIPGALKKAALDKKGNRQLLADLEAAGLLRPRHERQLGKSSYHLELGLWQEFFYDLRAIFPIIDASGEIVGLAGRAMTESNNKAPKYLYTPGFKKSENLYRVNAAFKALLNAAKEKKRTKKTDRQMYLDLYIVEGLFDALRLESLGHHAISILGADLSSIQAEIISKFSERLAVDFGVALRCHIFFDRDDAGIRGSTKALRMLLALNIESDFIWISNLNGKDPDELLKGAVTDVAFDNDFHPPLLAFLADSLGVIPSEILKYTDWQHISPQRFRTATERILKNLKNLNPSLNSSAKIQAVVDLITRHSGGLVTGPRWWLDQFIVYAVEPDKGRTSVQGLYIEDLFVRLDYARNLAWSSIQRGELPVDELAWRRFNSVSILFNRGLIKRLADADDAPIDAFDTVYVPRGFDQTDFRAKSLPGPEDLVLQQYVLAELLSERMGDSFRNCIPAVRYSRRNKETITTAETNDVINSETLSFAYQVDTDVLEGWNTPRESGIFRHYWDCWQDFIQALRTRTAKMEGKIHSVRLDLKRYYDNVQRSWVRDILLPSVQRAVRLEGISEKISRALAIPSGSEPEKIASHIVEWILKQSFGYNFYDPKNGKICESEPNVGLPQGPDLSAYLATVALFPIDRQMRNLLERINEEGKSPRAVYVRYVDDIILASDSEIILNQLRSGLEDALRGTNLQAINKHGPVRPMSKSAFSASLTEHRAFTASMPAPGFCLSPDGDGSAYFEGGIPENRSDALIVLNDPRLYFAPRESVLSGISAALGVHGELRHNEFVKAARWLWYLLSEQEYENITIAKLNFFKLWKEAFGPADLWNGVDVRERPWSDPAAYVIEGLDRLLSDKVLNWYRFTENERKIISLRLRRLADLVALPDIHNFFEPENSIANTPADWGVGLQSKLSRMFLQRLSAMRGKAYLLRGQEKLKKWTLPDSIRNATLRSSTRYIEIGAIESSNEDSISAHGRDGDISNWSKAFALLHEAIARLRSTANSAQDPLKGLAELIQNTDGNSTELTSSIIDPMLLWFAAENNLRNTKEIGRSSSKNEIYKVAINSFIAATPAPVLGQLLSHRFHLLSHLCGEENEPILALPMLGTTENNDENPFLYFFCGGKKLFALSYSTSSPPTKFFGQDWTAHQIETSEIFSWSIDIEPLTLYQIGSSSPDDIKSADVRKLGKAARDLIAKAITIEGENESSVQERPISAAHIFSLNTDEITFEIVADAVDRKILGNKAFIRDGSAGLRTISVPLEDAWLWRIGVALTDYFGFSDDLDHFAPLPNGESIKYSESEKPQPAWHIMREALYRLRGDLSFKRPGTHSDRALKFVPTGILRLINQLERFPTDDQHDHLLCQMAFLLAIMTETEAMRQRLNETSDFESPGAVVTFCQQLASNILRFKLKAQWSDWLPTSTITPLFLRRPVAAMSMVSSRIRALPCPKTNNESDATAWSALLLGLDIATASIAIRLTVLDLAVISGDDAILVDSRHDWNNSGYFNSEKNIVQKNLLDVFKNSTSGISGISSLDAISPYGWATLLNSFIESLSHKMPDQWANQLSRDLPTIRTSIELLLNRMSPQGQPIESESEWPFDLGMKIWINSESNLEPFSKIVSSITDRIDTVFGFQLIQKEESSFSYRDERFAGIYHLPKWRLVNWWPDKQRESKREGDRYVYPWTEVWQADRLVSVLTSSATLAKLAKIDKNNVTNIAANVDAVDDPNHKAPPLHDIKNIVPSGNEAPSRDVELEMSRNIVLPFQKIQHQAWRERSTDAENSQHVRVALFQWDLEDTYRHPSVDCGIPKSVLNSLYPNSVANEDLKVVSNRRGDEHLADRRSKDGVLEPENRASWAEHRRQKLLRSVITACAQFKVEVLVLPEYSVRPETIIAIKELLTEIDGAPAVYAGTYRMFGGALPERRTGKLGLPDSKHLDCQAILTLIEPPNDAGEIPISTRAKRYPSAAANEFFNPSTNTRSLFLERQQRLGGFDPLSVFIELVCSELFIATSPSNIYFLAAEYEKLLTRFGLKKTQKAILEQVQGDIREYADRTSFGRPRGFWPRKSILVVPAMTSRSADYWLFGQGAMLSSSMTTVFCNAVSGKHAVGGSCFIGRASWHQGDSGEGLLIPTPYHGWSHGILYSGKDDPLTDKEQALLIVDIDPVHMAEGKPRPQSLSNPLQLVAYIPVIETLKNSSPDSKYAKYENIFSIAKDMEEKVQSANTPASMALHHSVTGLSVDLDKIADEMLDGKNFKRRTAVWRNDSKEQPYFGAAPPSLVDWLWVDLTPRIRNEAPDIPTLLVPPWAS